MEESRARYRRSTAIYLLLAAFMAGSFAGAAFGVFFTLSLTPPSASREPQAASRKQAAASDDSAVISAVKKASPAVVSISVLKDVRTLYNRTGPLFPFEDFFGFPEPPQPAPAPEGRKQPVGGGTGFVISADGLIMTNRHVVIDEDAEYEVILQDETSREAKVLARDPILDLAVLKIEAAGLPIAELGDSDALEAGETVIAIGNALSEYRHTVTKGVVSGINRRVVAGGGLGYSEVIEEAIQTDAAINPGNSGGPLIDLEGRVIGVNTAVNRDGQSIGFAIPVNAAKTVIESIQRSGRIVRPWLGVRYVLLTKETAKMRGLPVEYGALVVKGSRPEDVAVVPGSPAEAAGIKENDVLLELDGAKIGEERSLAGLIGRKRAGDAVSIKLYRDGEFKSVAAVLGEIPENVR